MGFFDKLKKAVGKTGVELTYTWIEDPFAFTDPMIKATVTVRSSSGNVTVLGTTATLVAKRKDEDGDDEELALGEVSEEADEYSTTDRNGESVPVFPHTIKEGESEGFGIFLDDLDLPSTLEAWGATDAETAQQKGIEFFLKTEVDVKETNFMFDPKIEQKIEVC